jgi:hypothetical protein
MRSFLNARALWTLAMNKFLHPVGMTTLAFVVLLFTPGSIQAQDVKIYVCHSINPTTTSYFGIASSTENVGTITASFGKYLSGKYGTVAAPECETVLPGDNQIGARPLVATEGYMWANDKYILTDWDGTAAAVGKSNGDAPTEAGAIYAAENSATPPAGQYVQHWGAHTCQQVTTKSQYPTSSKSGLYSNPDKISFHCSVTFEYSAARSPIARSAVGDAATQELAIDAAKRLPIARHETVVEWGNPVCSQTAKITNQYNPSHPSIWWVCEVDYKK